MHNIILKNTKKTVKYINFVNPEIPGLSAAQSRDFGIGKFPGSRDCNPPGSRDPGIAIPSVVEWFVTFQNKLHNYIQFSTLIHYKMFWNFLLAFNHRRLTDFFDTESFYGRTCREPPQQNPEVRYDVIAVCKQTIRSDWK